MTLHVASVGAGPRVVLAHGFTQNGRCWGPFAERLAEHYEVVLVDLPGHGDSGHDDADLWRAADLLVEVGGDAFYVGYSMGGRIALHAALAHPRWVKGLVLIGATPGIEGEDDRAERRRADELLAQRLSADGLAEFLDGWLANPLFAGLPPESACRAERETNRVEGLAASLRHCGTGRQESLWSRLPELEMPVLAVAGAGDEKFRRIASRMAASIGPMATVKLDSGTHAVHLEAPDQIASLVSNSIDEWRMQ